MNIWNSKLYNMQFPHLKRLIEWLKKPRLTVPDSKPLSPCIIKPYTWENGKPVENKGYIPVSLLMKAIKNKHMLNIAVAGNYGVGKSSIIKTAKRHLSLRYKFINISLASLMVAEHKNLEKKGTVIKKAVTEKQIEYSILQQILYHDRPQKTPKSKIRRIHKTRWYKPFFIAVGIILIIVSLLLFVNPQWADVGRFITDEQSARYGCYLKWGPVFVLGLGIIAICWYLGRHYRFAITSIGAKNVEMRFRDKMSIFNAYMDEIVYFFESTRYNVVVFEDLDRFQSKEVIFYKLRELNTVLNNSRSIRRRINFVYAVSDELFDTTERVKFFDYIVSVIPVINSLNSYEKLKECIQPNELFEKLGRKELHNLCDYLQDMRLLLNIVNEFNQFAPLLDIKYLSEKILFGLVVYKNYVPSDFALMYNKGGVVATAIEKADEHRKEILADKRKVIEELQNRVIQTKSGMWEKIFQLRQQILDKGKSLSNYSSQNTFVQIEGEKYSFGDVSRNSSLFDEVKKDNFSFVTGNIVAQRPSFANIEKGLGGEGFYDKFVKEFNDEYENQESELNRSIRTLQEDIQFFPTTIQGIYQSAPTLLDEELKGIKDREKRQIVKVLFLQGYLDRHYQYYISYFYPNSLSREDRAFVMRAVRYEGVQYNTKLDNIGEVIKRFSPEDFETNRALYNVDLIREIYQNPSYKDFHASICKGITRDRNLDFVLAAYRSEPQIPRNFFFQLLRVFDYWDEIDKRKDVERDDLREIYLRFCEVRPGKVNPLFKKWLTESFGFFEGRWDRISTKRVLENLFKECAPVFNKLKLKDTPEEVFLDIINNNRYEFSRHNMKEISKRLGFQERFASASLTSILDTEIEALHDAVKKNFTSALKNVFPNTSIQEGEDAKTEIMNSSELRNEDKRYYLKKQRSRIQNANSIKDDVLDFAFDNSLVDASWRNVYYYSLGKRKGLPLHFLYNNSFKERVSNSLNKQEEQELAKMIVFSDQVKLPVYKELVTRFNSPFDSIPFEIQSARMRVLVEGNYLEFNEGNYHLIKSKYNLSGLFLVNNLESFLNDPEKYTIDSSDAVSALKTLDTKKSKCRFMRAVKDKMIAPNAELVSMVSPLLLSGDLKVDEVGLKLLIAIISSLPDDKRITVGKKAILSLPYDETQISDILQAIGGEYKRLTSDTAKSSVTYSLDAIRIVHYLESKGFLKGSERKGEKILVVK